MPDNTYEVIIDPVDKEGWVVVANGVRTTPRFNSKGAAEAYRDGLKRGERRPEFPIHHNP